MTATALEAPTTDLDLMPTASDLRMLPLHLLEASPDNPRADVGDVTELAQSIRENGNRLLQPIVVVPAHLYRAGADQMPDEHDGGRYVVVAGHRRRAACLQLGLAEVDCIVREDLVGPNAQIAMLVENLQRVDLSAIEEAQAFDMLRGLGLKQRDIADRVGRNQSHISKRLSLLKLPDLAREAVIAGDVTLIDAICVANLAEENPDQFKRAWDILTNSAAWQRMDGKRAVAQVLEEDALAAKVADALATLEAKGVKVITDRPDTYVYGQPGPRPTALTALDVKVASHRKLDCHVGYVDPRTAGIVYACVKPKTHIKPDTAAAAEKARAKVEKKALTEATKQRRETTLTLIKGNLSTPDRNQLLHHIVIAMATDSTAGSGPCAKVTLELLAGIHPREKSDRASSYHPYALREELQHWPTTAATIAIAIGSIEAHLEHPQFTRWASYRWYFELLERTGYVLADIEQERLGRSFDGVQWNDPPADAAIPGLCQGCGCTPDVACTGNAHPSLGAEACSDCTIGDSDSLCTACLREAEEADADEAADSAAAVETVDVAGDVL